jgi:deazaflavin-dependent oxidoreductase (nitroreductase family)
MARKYLKPGFFVARVANPMLMALGVAPTLAVRGRTSGEWRKVPVNVLELDGKRYLVAPRGDTNWARNLRAVKTGEIKTRKGTESFTATEIADPEKPAIIDAYLERWGSQVKSYFEQLPDPADHPVFEIHAAR